MREEEEVSRVKQSWTGPGCPGPWVGFSGVYLKVSREATREHTQEMGCGNTLRCAQGSTMLQAQLVVTATCRW